MLFLNFFGKSILHHFSNFFLKLGIVPLMFKIILNILFLFFNFKTKFMIDDSNRFLKTFHSLLHHFNCLDCLETKLITKSTDINILEKCLLNF